MLSTVNLKPQFVHPQALGRSCSPSSCRWDRASGAERRASLPGQRKLVANSLRIVTSPGRRDSVSIHGTEEASARTTRPFHNLQFVSSWGGGEPLSGRVCLMARSGSFLEGRGKVAPCRLDCSSFLIQNSSVFWIHPEVLQNEMEQFCVLSSSGFFSKPNPGFANRLNKDFLFLHH